MAIKQKAIKVGTSVAAVLPKALMQEVGIEAGTAINIEHRDNGIFISPAVQSSRKTSNQKTEDEVVAETALSLIKRYQGALKRLADA